ncbi:hypothetical protein K501DRAFT_276175 [Backusella circina FSU 941]|nr:hypothetical protein K501DRAFT_276175 [Backusella circina FSU 941]
MVLIRDIYGQSLVRYNYTMEKAKWSGKEKKHDFEGKSIKILISSGYRPPIGYVFSRFGIMVPNLIIISMNSDNVKFNTNKSYSDSIGVEKSINYLYYNSDSNSVKS